jgi:TolA-binding protein
MVRRIPALAAAACLAFFAPRQPLAQSPADEPGALGQPSAQERELVTRVYQARETYQRSLEVLRAHYIRSRQEEERYWVEQELGQYHMMVKDPYLLELDLPPKNLKPTQHSPQANQILTDAQEHLRKTTLTEHSKNYHRAELLLRRLLRDYPQSDKIDSACYQLGEIYSSKHYEQYRRGAAFYERALLYNPNTAQPARLKAALLYDLKLSDRGRAVQLYQEVLNRNSEVGQQKEARKRLDKLLSSARPTR